MLKLVFGRNINNRTEYVRNLVADGIKAGNSGYIIIVPEQFSYETEKAMLEKVGAKGLLNVEVISLSRLADVILEEQGAKGQRQQVDDGIKLMTMSLTLEALADKLNVFKKYITRPALIENLVSFATEMKQCSVTVDMFSEYIENRKDSSLKAKIKELIPIISLYNAMLEKDYYNTDDAFDILCELFNTYKYFENKTVVIDGFTRFTKQESKVIEKAIMQCDEIYVTFNTDYKSFSDDFSLFANVNKQIENLKNIAAKCNVKIAKPIIVDEYDKSIDGNLLLLEKNFFKVEKENLKGVNPESITLLSAPNKADECEFIAQSIKRLMRENAVRCRDIIVFERSKDSYDNELASAFKKYGIPFYEDKRQPVDNQPLIVYLKCLFDIACNGISTESLLRYLKTDLTDLTAEEISMLENYAFIWKIKPSQWKKDFVDNPRGFGSELSDSDKAMLMKLNELRKKAVGPVLAFKKDFSQAVGEQKTVAVYEFLEKNGIRFRIKDIAQKLYESGNQVLSEEQDTVWSLVTEMLDKLYIVSGQGDLSVKRYSELFDLLLSVSDFGTLPRGLDEVTIGVADRTRTTMKKYVFIVGANDGVFPLCPSTQGLLNDKDRIALRTAGIELAETAEYKQIEEKYIAYSVVTSAITKLFVTYSESDYSGVSKTKSAIIDEIKEIFPDIKEIRYEQLDLTDRIESDYSAFEVYAESYKYNNTLSSTLEKYFDDNILFKGKVDSLKTAAKKKKLEIEDKNTAVELFGNEINMSASKIQAYHECPFKYYCRYGIGAEPLKAAEVDPLLSGSVVHEIFEIMLKEYSKPELTEMSDNDIYDRIIDILTNYLEEKMGGKENKSKRFLQQYFAIGMQTFNILKRIIEELKTCEFTPVDFELRIRDDSEIQPYMLKLRDGGSLKIIGSVDRVDTMDKDGNKYLRVVDYKSGGKTFRLSDVFGGLSIQMLVYLFAIAANGKKKYGEIIPSGVLYMSAKTERPDLPRNAEKSEIEHLQLRKNKMSGLVLDNITVAEGMEKELQGYFIPVKLNKKSGELSGNLISSEELKKLNKKVDEILIKMGESLHNGKIEVLPVSADNCKYCDYKCICHFEDGDETRIIKELSHEEALEELMREGDESNE